VAERGLQTPRAMLIASDPLPPIEEPPTREPARKDPPPGEHPRRDPNEPPGDDPPPGEEEPARPQIIPPGTPFINGRRSDLT